jgi:hypothetical protein
MIRMAVAGVLGFVLVIIESMLVLHLRGYETIDFGGMAPFVNVWAMNFFLVYSILTQVTNWYVNREGFKEDNSF